MIVLLLLANAFVFVASAADLRVDHDSTWDVVVTAAPLVGFISCCTSMVLDRLDSLEEKLDNGRA